MLFTEFLDDLGAGRGLVADRAAADLLFERVDSFAGENRRINGEGLVEPDYRHFPMAGGRVFAGQARGPFSEGSDRSGGWRQMFQRGDVGEPHFHERWNLEGPRLGDVPEGISADVAIVCRVQQLVSADY